MSIEAALYAKLATAGGAVANLVGARIYPIRAPQDAAMPYILFQRISGLHEHSHDGISGLAEARFQITSVATTYLAAGALAEAVRLAIDGQGPVTWSTVIVCSVFLENDSDEPYEVIPGSEAGYVGVRQDWQIAYQEAQA